jgi:hypothetical protein
MNRDACIRTNEDERERQLLWRSVRTMLLVLFYSSLALVVYLWLLSPHWEFWTVRERLQKKAYATYHDPSCRNPQTRIDLGPYLNCETAEYDKDMSPFWGAWDDTLHALPPCRKGVCSVFGHNISHILTLLVVLVLALVGWGIVQTAWACLSLALARAVSSTSLPTTQRVTAAAYAKSRALLADDS